MSKASIEIEVEEDGRIMTVTKVPAEVPDAEYINLLIYFGFEAIHEVLSSLGDDPLKPIEP